MVITKDQLAKIIHGDKPAAEWIDAVSKIEQYGIDNPRRIAAFLAQCAHESGDFMHLSENLNYSAQGLKATWPKRFTDAIAAQYARQPEKIANYVYANRLGNGDEKSGDGWKYRGRGLVQITGKSAYGSCSVAMYKDDRLIKNPELLATDKDAAIKSAVWFWNTRNLNPLADDGRISEITKLINGGFIGLDDRVARYKEALSVLGAS